VVAVTGSAERHSSTGEPTLSRRRTTTPASGRVAITVIVGIGENAARDGTGLLLDEGIASVHHARGDGDRADFIQVSAVLVGHADITGRLGFNHSVSAGRKIAETVAAVRRGGRGDRVPANQNRSAARINQSKSHTADRSVAGIVVVRIREHGTADGTGEEITVRAAVGIAAGNRGEGGGIIAFRPDVTGRILRIALLHVSRGGAGRDDGCPVS